MLTELFGLPGSGKSYFVRKKNVLCISGKGELSAYFLLFLLRHPFISLHLIFETCRNINTYGKTAYPRLLAHKIIGALMHACAKYMKFRWKHHDPKVRWYMDEGLLQLVFTIYDKASESRIHKTLKKVESLLGQVLILEIDEKTRQQRLKERGIYPRSHLGNSYFHIWDTQSLKTFEIMKSYLSQKPYVEVIRTK